MSEGEPPASNGGGGGSGGGSGAASSEEAERVIREVLQDQARRKQRREEVSRTNDGTRLLPLPLVALLWGVVCLTVWVATPSFLLPEPIPRPEPAEAEAGLRMQMLSVVGDIDRYEEEAGRVPQRLEEVTAEPPRGLEYLRLSPSTYRLVGVRGEIEIVYQSGTPTEEFLGDARRRIERGGES